MNIMPQHFIPPSHTSQRVDLPAFTHLIAWEASEAGQTTDAVALVYCTQRRALVPLDALSWNILKALAYGANAEQARWKYSLGNSTSDADLKLASANAAQLADPAHPLPDLPFVASALPVQKHNAPIIETLKLRYPPALVQLEFCGVSAKRAIDLLKQVEHQAITERPNTPTPQKVKMTVTALDNNQYVLYTPDDKLITCANHRQLVGMVVSTAFEARRATLDYRFMLHAAAIRFCGIDWLIPARSGAGKSTLALALIERGGYVFADDVIALGTTFQPLPTATPLAIKESGWKTANINTELPIMERLDKRRFVAVWPDELEPPTNAQNTPAIVVVPQFTARVANIAVQALTLPETTYAFTSEGYQQCNPDNANDAINFIDYLLMQPAYHISYGDCSHACDWMKHVAKNLCTK